MGSAAQHKSMELEGQLGAFHLPEILRFLAMGKMTGVLTLSGQGRKVSLSIQEGHVVGTHAADRHLKLGQLLVYNGIITRKDLDETLEEQQCSKEQPMLGELLIERELAERRQVEQCLELQTKEELWDLFSWDDGEFKFEHGLPLGGDRILVSLDIEPLIEEGSRRMAEWRTISSRFSDLKTFYRVKSDLNAIPETRIHPNTWRVLSLINGRHSIEALIYMSGLGKFETLCALDQLISLQLIEPCENQWESDGLSQTAGNEAGHAPIRQPASAEADSNGETDRAHGSFGLFRLRRKSTPAQSEPKAGRPEPPGPFITTVGLAAGLINRLLEQLEGNPDFLDGEEAEPIVWQGWNEAVSRYPRSDLLRLRGVRFDAGGFERFVESAEGVDEALSGSHEDSMEALALVAERLRERAQQKMGESGDALVVQCARPFMDGVHIQYPTDFLPRTWVRQWMETLL